MTQQELAIRYSEVQREWRRVAAEYEDAVDDALIELSTDLDYFEDDGVVLVARARRQCRDLLVVVREAAAKMEDLQGLALQAQVAIGDSVGSPYRVEVGGVRKPSSEGE